MIDFVVVQQYNGFTSDVTSLIFSPKENILYAGSFAGTVIAYDLHAQTVLNTFKEHLAATSALAVCGAQLLATGSADTKVKLWDLR